MDESLQRAKSQEIQDKVCVAVRVRPLSQKELREGGKSSVDVSASQVTLTVDVKQPPMRYNFDNVFDSGASQEQVYKSLGLPLLDRALEGYNCTVFAYGQTGAGKTHTMLNHQEDEQRGLVPRFAEELFERITRIQNESPHQKFLVQCSFLEIYNEILYDLFVPTRSKAATGLEIREQKGIGIYVKDLTEIVVESCSKLIALIHQGFDMRATAATKMNQASSRSHCIITIKLNRKDDQDSSNNTFSSVSLVDLAGSERAKDTGAEGTLLKEGANINKSLSALGNVINALSSQSTSQKKLFIPYRNSKLTRVLQESLGGNSFCTMLANISPASVNSEETLSTLNYAKRAKVIRVKAIKNEEVAKVAKLNSEVDHLRERLQEQAALAMDTQIEMDSVERENIEEKYNRQIEELQSMIKQTWQDKQQISAQHEEERNKLLEEARRKEEELVSQRRRRLALLEEKDDLALSLREVQTLDSDLCCTWAGLVVEAQASEQRLRAQVHGVQLCRESVKLDMDRWWDAHSKSSPDVLHHLHQAAGKLEAMQRELETLQNLEASVLNALASVAPEADRALRCCSEDEEVAGVLSLVVRQLSAYQQRVHQFVAGARLDFAMEEEKARLCTALGNAESIRALPDVADDMRLEPLGLANFTLEDDAISASSNQDVAACARLLHAEGPYGGWCAGADAVGEYIEIDLRKDMYVAGISTQGRVPATGGWQQTRALLNCVIQDKPLLNGEPLPSNDRVYMRPPVRFIHEVACTLIERFGILKNIFTKDQMDYTQLASKEARTAFFQTLIESVRVVEGMETIDLTAGDILAGKNTAGSGKLLQTLAYMALSKGRQSQGGLIDVRLQWTTRFTVEWTSGAAAEDWQFVRAGQDDPARVFEGNTDGTSIKFVAFEPFCARRVRVRPVEWHNHPAIRLELHGSEQPSKRACHGLVQRLQELATAVSTLRQRAENEQEERVRLERIERAQKLAQVAQVEQEHADMEKKLLSVQADLEELQELRKWKVATERSMIEAEAARLQLHIDRNRAESLAKQLREDLKLDVEARTQSDQALAIVRSENERLRCQVDDMEEQMQVLTEERDAAQLREEDIFEQMLAMEETLVDTTEGYLTDKLKETEKEVDLLKERLVEEDKRRKAFRRLFRAMKDQPGISAQAAEGLQLAAAKRVGASVDEY
eukprot:TRINITY_DN5741_c0_g2_i1.p1 TRINITY_DN5741_c0_g2~~TRINITY_DN5741_c0_g2_i1.p1  ORF type:complete len:1176 (-),score=203.57 TRINITY_DN5741_c0_g2_i1:156-3683(-)